MSVVRLLAHWKAEASLLGILGGGNRRPLLLGDYNLNYRIEKHAGGESSVAYSGNGDREKVCSKLALLMQQALGLGTPTEIFFKAYEEDTLIAEARIPASVQEPARE